jgi:hypothetical protein
MDLLCVVDIEEIRVQHCLDDARQDRDGMEIVLREVPIYPVRDIKTRDRVQGQRDSALLWCLLHQSFAA